MRTARARRRRRRNGGDRFGGHGEVQSALKSRVLIAATLLSIPSRRIRALALGDEDALRDWLANESVTRLEEARRDARAMLERIAEAGAGVVAIDDPAYPSALRDLADPPPFLVVRGTVPASVAGGTGTAIVGTRAPAERGKRYAFVLAGAAPGPIVSGLALGIDAAAHRGALAAGTPTIAYVAHGLGDTFPPEHAALEDEILAAGGAIASERLPGDRVTRSALVRRDRLQAAHARAVVLVESEVAGGAMHTMDFAKRLGRARFVRSAGSGEELATGNARALAEGASPLETDAAAAAIRLRWRSGPVSESREKQGELVPFVQGNRVNAAFKPFDLERAKTLIGDELDALPFGVIVVDRSGTILEYNAYESEFAGFTRERVLGRNFFHDVAPCTAIHEFEGRFVRWLDSPDTSIEPFQFEFPFSRGAQNVSVIFVRTAFDATRATICVVRRGASTDATTGH